MSIRALIVDDEPPARDELRFLLEQLGVRVIGEAGNGFEALEEIERLDPDVVFLDVQMSGMSGFECAQRLLDQGRREGEGREGERRQGERHKGGRLPLIVFATAYDEFAIKAFEINAVDYVLKPFEQERLAKTVARLEQALDGRRRIARRLENLLESLATYPEAVRQQADHPQSAYPQVALRIRKVPAERQGKLILVDADQVFFAFTRGGQVFLKTYDEEILTHLTLREAQDRLGDEFLRIHKSYVVNLNKVKEVIPWFHGTYNLVVDDKQRTEVPVGRAQIREVKQIFGL
ncbi:MAG: LytTR family transcriptional regulator DNA-binding domain-containing protein [Firmicutes bacterium]|nr:LytTR family transcriptional regulator DNA-binding domain-containing protein [Bacillota bacterium]